MNYKEIFAKRLKQSRQKAGLSMDALSRLTGGVVSKQTISKYEAGKTIAGSAVLCKLAEVLDINVEYLFKPFSFDISNAKISFRKKASVRAKDEANLKICIQDEVERFLDIERILGIETVHHQINVPKTIKTTAQMRMLANELRVHWELGNSPISNATGLLVSKGIKVFEVSGPNGFDGISGKTNDSTMIIVVNKDVKHSERTRLTKFHELAHLFVNESFSPELSKYEQESLCNAFAAEMLIPSEVLEKRFGHKSVLTFQDLVKMQTTYGISIDAIMYTLKRLGVISDKRYRSYCIRKNMDNNFKQAVEKSRYIESNCEDQLLANDYPTLVYTALAQGLITSVRASELLKCDLSEVETHNIAF